MPVFNIESDCRDNNECEADLESLIMSADDSSRHRFYNLEKMSKSWGIIYRRYKAPLDSVPFDVIVLISNPHGSWSYVVLSITAYMR